ncbi:MAG TPA: hypothetical protein VNT56_04835 [Acidimicrobiales bacterium]|jgi:hypothetical protein|nr:hypothetical protein [Acidimicrobiales bacterium]
MRTTTRKLTAAAFAATLAFTGVACDDDDEGVGNEVEEGVDDVQEGVNEGADEVQEGAENVEDEVTGDGE